MKQYRPAGLLLLLAGVTACDLPTGMPRWDTTWITPAEETTIHVVELLPAGLGVTPDTSAFELAIEPVSESWTLRDFCAACPLVTTVAPKPAFTATVSTTTPLPAAVQSVDVEGGSIDIVLTNGFGFDPIRPGVSSDSGSITITVTSGSATVASLVLDGRTQSFAPNTTKNLSLAYVPSTVGGDLDVDLTIVSPAGDAAPMNPNDALGFTLSSDGVLVSEASISVAGQTIEGIETELDLQDVDVENIKDGTILLDVENPFGVTGALTIAIEPAGGAAIVKQVALPAGSASAQVHFSEEEMQRLVGVVSSMSISGTLNPGTVTVRPDMAITIGMRLRVTVEVGGSDEDENND